MSVCPHAGIIDFGTFTPPENGLDGIQGEVPAPLASEAGYILSSTGWVLPTSLLGNIDGGSASSVYGGSSSWLYGNIDGGSATSVYSSGSTIDCGGA